MISDEKFNSLVAKEKKLLLIQWNKLVSSIREITGGARLCDHPNLLSPPPSIFAKHSEFSANFTELSSWWNLAAGIQAQIVHEYETNQNLIQLIQYQKNIVAMMEAQKKLIEKLTSSPPTHESEEEDDDSAEPVKATTVSFEQDEDEEITEQRQQEEGKNNNEGEVVEIILDDNDDDDVLIEQPHEFGLFSQLSTLTNDTNENEQVGSVLNDVTNLTTCKRKKHETSKEKNKKKELKTKDLIILYLLTA